MSIPRGARAAPGGQHPIYSAEWFDDYAPKLRARMAAFDALPRIVRDAVNRSAAPGGVEYARNLMIDNHDLDVVVQLIERRAIANRGVAHGPERDHTRDPDRPRRRIR